MSYFLRNAKREILVTPLSLAVGGEGQCCMVRGVPDESVKIYKEPIPEDLEARLEYEIKHTLATIASRLAWPKDIVEDGSHVRCFLNVWRSVVHSRWAHASPRL